LKIAILYFIALSPTLVKNVRAAAVGDGIKTFKELSATAVKNFQSYRRQHSKNYF
jgi:hypothetical protein